MTLTEIKTKLAELNREAKLTDEAVEELRRAIAEGHKRADALKERSDIIQRRLASA